MLGYKLTRSAALDLEDILKYTVENWGLEQAEQSIIATTTPKQTMH